MHVYVCVCVYVYVHAYPNPYLHPYLHLHLHLHLHVHLARQAELAEHRACLLGLGVELLGRARQPSMDQPEPFVPQPHLVGARRNLPLQEPEARLASLAAQLGRPQLLERRRGVRVALR